MSSEKWSLFLQNGLPGCVDVKEMNELEDGDIEFDLWVYGVRFTLQVHHDVLYSRLVVGSLMVRWIRRLRCLLDATQICFQQ